jgi:hypothetical protein
MKRTHPGRPPLDDDDATEHVCMSLPSKQVRAYRRLAARDDVSVPEIIRRELRERKPPPRIKI